MSRFRLYLPALLLILVTIMRVCEWPKTDVDLLLALFAISFGYLIATTAIIGLAMATPERGKTVSADEFWAKINGRTVILGYFFGTIWLASIIAWMLVDTALGQQLRTLILD